VSLTQQQTSVKCVKGWAQFYINYHH